MGTIDIEVISIAIPMGTFPFAIATITTDTNNSPNIIQTEAKQLAAVVSDNIFQNLTWKTISNTWLNIEFVWVVKN